MWTGTPDIDVVAPVAPENVSGIPGANFNLVTLMEKKAKCMTCLLV